MLDNEIKKYKDNQEILKNYSYALFIMGYDEQTDCPTNGKEYSLNVQSYFRRKLVDIITSDDYVSNIKYLNQNTDKLDEIMRLEIEREFKEIDKLERVPKEELYKHYDNINRASLAWQKAHDTKNFDLFERELEELVEYNKKYISWQKPVGNEGFDTLLDECEEGFTSKMYDEYFSILKKEIVPLAFHIYKQEKKYNSKLDSLKFPIAIQRELTNLILNKMGYTNKNGCVRETIHPFTNGAHANDVRITTSYDEALLFSNLYSIMHEAGHALYELGCDTSLDGTNLFGGTSMGIHESQSRFYENYLGRSRSFVKFLTPILKDFFKEELKDITEDDIYYYVNNVSNQLTRTEADELSYSLHILIRYEVECMLFRNEISTSDISDVFNKKCKEYLNNVPKDKLEGCFQDVHWSSSFGYFPTYALGNAIGAQIFYSMKKDLDIDALMLQGDFLPINSWLKEKIHKYGKTKKSNWLIKNATGEEFNPTYYIKYLKEKFSEIYKL